MKKIIFTLLMFCFFITVSASTVPLVKIGNMYYETIEDAINEAGPNDIISLINNIELNNTLNINKVVNINLNGNNITAREKVFEVKGGFLTLSGKGVVKETSPNYGAIILIGSSQPTDEKYSSVRIGPDITLEGWSGIFITHDNFKSYGVYADVEGTINAVNDISGGTGIGIYVNGKIKDKNYSPIVNIMDSAKITSTGNGLYMAGYSTFYIEDAYIEGLESAIGIKSGKLIIDGATLVCNGEDKTPTGGYNNGIKPSGTTIQIESNTGYTGDIEIDISRGNFISKNSNVIYEYIGKGNNSKIYSMSISGGTFTSGKNKDVFSFSDSFKNIHSGFIRGGEYSTDPSNYLKNDYTVIKDNNYNVVKNTSKEVISYNIKESNKNSFIKILISLIVLIIIVIIGYLNKNKLLKHKN